MMTGEKTGIDEEEKESLLQAFLFFNKMHIFTRVLFTRILFKPSFHRQAHRLHRHTGNSALRLHLCTLLFRRSR